MTASKMSADSYLADLVLARSSAFWYRIALKPRTAICAEIDPIRRFIANS